MIAVALQSLESAEVQMLPLRQLSTNEAFQPRVERIVPFRDRSRVTNGSSSQVDSLRLRLESSQEVQLDPIWAIEIADSGDARIPDGLYVVDGHHRLTAYGQAQRKSIPVCACSSDFRTAVLISKLVNCSGRALEMHGEQKRDAAWQYLAAVTQQGAIDPPDGQSLRVIGGRFGVSKNTVASMLRQMKDVVVSDYSSVAIDPGTGYPRWRWVREHNAPWKEVLDAVEVPLRTQRNAERFARIVLALRKDYSHEVRVRAFELLKAEDASETHEGEEGAVGLFVDIVRNTETDVDYLLSL